jgi:hypothetical protein
MIETTPTPATARPRRWLRPVARACRTHRPVGRNRLGCGQPRLPPDQLPDTAKVRAALKLRLPKTPIDAINCEGLGGLCEVASKSTLFYVDRQSQISGDRPHLRHGSAAGSDGSPVARTQSQTCWRLVLHGAAIPRKRRKPAAARQPAERYRSLAFPRTARSPGDRQRPQGRRLLRLSTAATARSSKQN